MTKSWNKISKIAEKNHTQILIKTVEKYPAVWNTRHPDYQNVKQRELAWEHICATVIPDWIICKDKLHKCLDLKKKWTHVTDYYRKRLQLAKLSFASTGDDSFRRRYIYEDLLHYIKPILIKLIGSREEGNCSNDDTSLEPATYITLRASPPLPSPSPSPAISLPSSSASSSPAPSPAPSSPAPSSPVHSPVRKRFKSEPPNRADASVSPAVNPLQLEQNKGEAESHHSSQDEWNNDTKFLLSFRRYMKKMSDEQKVEFQIGMLKLVKKTFWEGS